MLNLHRDKKNVRREPGRDGKILCDHRQDGNDEVHRLNAVTSTAIFPLNDRVGQPRELCRLA